MELHRGSDYDYCSDYRRSCNTNGGEKMTALITDIKRMAVHDGPGIRTTVFFKGCPLRCVWCHNPENIAFQPQDTFYTHKCIDCQQCKQDHFTLDRSLGQARVHYGTTVTVDELLPMLLEDKAFYDNSGGGVTLSGGEPLMQGAFCAEVLSLLKGQIHTAIETSGYAKSEIFQQVVSLCDFVYMDLKLADEAQHKAYTGVSNKQILENAQWLKESGIPHVFRTPLIPGITDTEENLEAIAAIVGDHAWEKLAYNSLAGAKYASVGRTFAYKNKNVE
jgi:pyruvate formate lyase activating enzyme